MVKSKNKTTKKTNKAIKLARTPKYQSIAAVIVIIAAAILGYFLFIASHAASPYTTAEAESGSLAGSACSQSSLSGASNNSYVQFGGSCSGSSSSSGGNGVPLLGLWDDGTVSASSLGVTQQATLIFASTASSGDTYCSYSSLSNDLVKGTIPILSIGDCSSSEATTMANYLVSNGESNAYIRPMWEMNTDDFGWQWGENYLSAAQYISAWKTMYTAMKAVSSKFQFIWCPNGDENITTNGAGNNESGRNSVDTYPGDAYVDLIGVDVYDHWSGTLGGLPAFQSWNVSGGHNKPMAVPEWGLNGSDDPTFINTMSTFVHTASNDVAVQSYFSYDGGTNSDLTQFSSSKSAYETDFKGE